jgi:hypothetical protein
VAAVDSDGTAYILCCNDFARVTIGTIVHMWLSKVFQAKLLQTMIMITQRWCFESLTWLVLGPYTYLNECPVVLVSPQGPPNRV